MTPEEAKRKYRLWSIAGEVMTFAVLLLVIFISPKDLVITNALLLFIVIETMKHRKGI